MFSKIFNSKKKCKYCLTRGLISLNSKSYCESCETYYTFVDNEQIYSHLPIDSSAEALSLDCFCKKCRKHFNKRVIRCKTFSEYLAAFGLCSNCKRKNYKLIKNAFFKSFILHKKHVNAFSWAFVIFYSILFIMFKDWVLFHAVSIFYIDYSCGKFGIKTWFAVLSLLLSRRKLCTSYFYLCYCLYRIFRSKVWVYDVPIDLTKQDYLLEHFDRLNIDPKKKKLS